jgi:hypothetical protein
MQISNLLSGQFLHGAAGSFRLATLVYAASISIAAAQTDDARFSLSVGVFITDRDSDAHVNASNGNPGTVVNLEDDLGLDKSDTVFRIDGFYRFADNHRIDFSAFDLSRSASTQIARDITWKDMTYALSTTVDADFDLTIYKVAYTWLFLKKERSFLGATAGLYIADIGASLSAPSVGSREVGDATAPLPVFGLRGKYGFAEKWALRASGEIFVLEYGDFNGSLVDVFVGLDFNLFTKADVGIGLNSVRMDIGITKDNLNGAFDWQYDGALAYLKFDF